MKPFVISLVVSVYKRLQDGLLGERETFPSKLIVSVARKYIYMYY